MTHELMASPTSIGLELYEFSVRLIAENESEGKAIINTELGNANEDENMLIYNYLRYGIPGWSALSVKK